jgi:ferredoxin-NADP reductase
MHSADTQNLTVTQMRMLTSHVVALTLRHPDGAALPAYQAGAHVKIQVDINGKAEWRHYSLIDLHGTTTGSKQPDEYLVAVRREDIDAGGRGGSLYLHTQIEPGQQLQVSHPINAFPLDPTHDDAVLIAGGIGITPILSMMSALHAGGKKCALHYTGRSFGQMAFLPELRTMTQSVQHVHSLSLYADDASEAERLNLRAMLSACSPDQPIYACGPKGMISAVRDIARQLGWHPDHVHYELFAEAAAEAGDQPFEVELVHSGVCLQVPADKTILEVMIEAGLDPLFDCKRGDCGVCTVAVLEGEVDHRDNSQTDTERASGGMMQICISRAKGKRLVLEA